MDEKFRGDTSDAWRAYIRGGMGSGEFIPVGGESPDKVFVPDFPTSGPLTIEGDGSGGDPPQVITAEQGDDERRGRPITFINEDGTERTIWFVD